MWSPLRVREDLGDQGVEPGEARFAAPLAHTAFLAFLEASARGRGRLDDSAVMRNYTDNRGAEH